MTLALTLLKLGWSQCWVWTSNDF